MKTKRTYGMFVNTQKELYAAMAILNRNCKKAKTAMLAGDVQRMTDAMIEIRGVSPEILRYLEYHPELVKFWKGKRKIGFRTV